MTDYIIISECDVVESEGRILTATSKATGSRWLVVSNLLIATNIEQASCFVLRSCGKRLTTGMVL